MRHVGKQVRKSVSVRMTPVPFTKTMSFIMRKAGYHHDADFVDVYIIIFSGARFSPSSNTSFYTAGYTLFTLATRLTAQIYY
ncbi:hypothetical protein HID58_080094 [Brassica napus]|uniref:Uncharacterized protein n=1 Tax=Brassica napus TaxID=3708 RepID=A0ABQ7Y3Y1_BRANA|nr:hypothetical protein HID58_080094 [Brassica napus]